MFETGLWVVPPGTLWTEEPGTCPGEVGNRGPFRASKMLTEPPWRVSQKLGEFPGRIESVRQVLGDSYKDGTMISAIPSGAPRGHI